MVSRPYPRPSVFLHQFPVELKLEVVEHLDEPAKQCGLDYGFESIVRRENCTKALKALTLTCHEANQLATPLLFRDYDVLPVRLLAASRPHPPSALYPETSFEEVARYHVETWPTRHSSHAKRLICSTIDIDAFRNAEEKDIEKGFRILLDAAKRVCQFPSSILLIVDKNPLTTLGYQPWRTLIDYLNSFPSVSSLLLFAPASQGPKDWACMLNVHRKNIRDLCLFVDPAMEVTSLSNHFKSLSNLQSLSLFWNHDFSQVFNQHFLKHNMPKLRVLTIGTYRFTKKKVCLSYENLFSLLSASEKLRDLTIVGTLVPWSIPSPHGNSSPSSSSPTSSKPKRFPNLPCLKTLRLRVFWPVTSLAEPGTECNAEVLLDLFQSALQLREIELGPFAWIQMPSLRQMTQPSSSSSSLPRSSPSPFPFLCVKGKIDTRPGSYFAKLSERRAIGHKESLRGEKQTPGSKGTVVQWPCLRVLDFRFGREVVTKRLRELFSEVEFRDHPPTSGADEK